MDPIKNPFSPGAGSPPPELVGRDPVLEQARILLGRTRLKRSEKSMLLTGLRGVGKTVLLNEIERLAEADGYRTILVEALEDKPLGPLIAPHLRTLLFDLDRTAGAGDKAKRGLRILRGFVGALKVTVGEISFGLDIDPQEGTADSGDLEIDLPSLLVAVAEAAQERNGAVAILIDELQYFSTKELGALIMSMHRMQQLRLPLVLLGAGLPILPGLAGQAKSYAERLFGFPDVGALSEEDAIKALRDPALAAGVVFQADALYEIFQSILVGARQPRRSADRPPRRYEPAALLRRSPRRCVPVGRAAQAGDAPEDRRGAARRGPRARRGDRQPIDRHDASGQGARVSGCRGHGLRRHA